VLHFPPTVLPSDTKRISIHLVCNILHDYCDLSLTYLKVHVIKGALQQISIPPSDTFIATLGGDGWTPGLQDTLIFQGSNPNQDPRVNLKDCAVTRTVGGMATHWTCACRMLFSQVRETGENTHGCLLALPNKEETEKNPISQEELSTLLTRASRLLNVHDNQYDVSIRHTVVKKWLTQSLPKERNVQSLRLAVERRHDNPDYVTWTGTDTVLGADLLKDPRFELWQETLVKSLHQEYQKTRIAGALVRRLPDDEDEILVVAKVSKTTLFSNTHICRCSDNIFMVP